MSERDPFVLESNDPAVAATNDNGCWATETLPDGWVYRACPYICEDLGRCGLK